MSGLLHLAAVLRHAAAVIIAMLELNRTGQPAPVELRQAGEDVVRDLLGLASNLSKTVEVGEGDDGAPRH